MKDKISIQLQDFSFQGKFPDLCVYCGKSKNTDLTYKMTKQEKQNDQTLNHEIELLIPYCDEHAKIYRRNTIIITVIALIGGVIAAYIAIQTYFYINENGMFGMKEGAGLFLAGLITVTGTAGITFIGVGLIFLSIARFIIQKISVYPIGNPLGLAITISENTNTIDFIFQNVDIEQKFREINIEFINQEIS